ncbi:MAG: glycosyltransferase family 52 protein [Lachnospiraceae bacterium]|nr:glycosyltransferase family 52 protein [Lachnospiraceae bacterium]
MSDNNNSKKRIYICHTYYHAYVAVVKELILGKDHYGESDIILSTLSNNFGNLDERLREAGVFGQVYMYDEKDASTSPKVMSHHCNRGNLIANMFQRILYTRELGKLQEPYIPVDLKLYKDIYVFCDSDPIGYYLNYKKIPYHALEDGLNSGKLDDQALLANKRAFKFKCLLSKIGLIFIECGYGRYCMDYEVNDIKANHNVPPNVIEVPRRSLTDKLSSSDHDTIVRIFLEDADELTVRLDSSSHDKPFAMILTEPLCEPEVRKRLFKDVIDMYKNDHDIIIKPHPRDVVDYEKEFPECITIKGRFPMEVMNDIKDFKVDKIVSVITQVDNVRFADSIEYLGLDFLDKYEDPRIHRRLDTLQ